MLPVGSRLPSGPEGENLMSLFGLSNYYISKPDLEVGILALTLLSCCAIWMFFRWFLTGPAPPDPWNEQVTREVESGETRPICHRCLTPHDVMVDFCPECGAPVGDYTNLLPFPYLFSIGHTLRIGTAGEFRRSPLTIAGFILLGIAEYTLFAPVYWLVFLWRLFHRQPTQPSVPQAQS